MQGYNIAIYIFFLSSPVHNGKQTLGLKVKRGKSESTGQLVVTSTASSVSGPRGFGLLNIKKESRFRLEIRYDHIIFFTQPNVQGPFFSINPGPANKSPVSSVRAQAGRLRP